MFSQLLPIIPRGEFDKLVHSTGVGRGLKGFSCWDQLVALLFCQLGHAHSLREISDGLASCAGKLNHLGVKKAPPVSSLSYANRTRSPELFEQLFYLVFNRVSSQHTDKHKFRFKNKLISLDASVIDLCLSMYDRALFRRTKGAVKLHLQLDHDGYLPRFVCITDGTEHEITVARKMHFEKGTIVVFDRGYNDYDWFNALSAEGVFFVTRLKSNASYRVIEDFPVVESKGVLSDQKIVFSCHEKNGEALYTYRLVRARDKETGEVYEFLTNNHKLSSATIAAIYKDRWQIELFFKSIKQNLKIKTFLGTNANAVKSQIWTALIAMLLVKYLKLRSKYKWSLSNLVTLLRMNLFVHRDLWEWIDKPICPPPEPMVDEQGVLVFT